jgi:hypothetical protein
VKAEEHGRVFPGKSRATRTPAQAGLERAKLDVLRDFVGGCGCIVRGEHLVYSWGDITKRADVASAFKPSLVHLLLHLLDQGVTKPVAAFSAARDRSAAISRP